MPRTRIEKLWLGGAAVVALLIAVIGYFFLVSPQRARTQDVKTQVADAQLQATTLQGRIISLTSEQKKLPAFRIALAQARAALPTADDVSATPALLRSLQAIAHASSTSVSSLTVGDPAAVAAAPAPAAPSTSASPAPATSATTTDGATPTNLYSVAITASVSGSTKQLVAFLSRLQSHQPRAVLISSVTLAGDSAPGASSAGGETMSLVMTAFVRPPATTATPSATTPTPSK